MNSLVVFSHHTVVMFLLYFSNNRQIVKIWCIVDSNIRKVSLESK